MIVLSYRFESLIYIISNYSRRFSEVLRSTWRWIKAMWHSMWHCLTYSGRFQSPLQV